MKIKQLPHWARIAFAARRARKILPLFDEYWPGVLQSTRRELEETVRYAEQSAATGQAGIGETILEILVMGNSSRASWAPLFH